MNLAQVIASTRRELQDANGIYHTDERVEEALDTAMAMWARDTGSYMGRYALDVQSSQAMLDLSVCVPRVVDLISAYASFGGSSYELEVLNVDDLAREPGWEARTASRPTHIVRDLFKPQELRLWPKPVDASLVTLAPDTLYASANTGFIVGFSTVTGSFSSADIGALLGAGSLYGGVQLYYRAAAQSISAVDDVEDACGATQAQQPAILAKVWALLCMSSAAVAEHAKATGYEQRYAAEAVRAASLQQIGTQARSHSYPRNLGGY